MFLTLYTHLQAIKYIINRYISITIIFMPILKFPQEMARNDSLACVIGKKRIRYSTHNGNLSSEKNVLHKNVIGSITNVENLATSWCVLDIIAAIIPKAENIIEFNIIITKISGFITSPTLNIMLITIIIAPE